MAMNSLHSNLFCTATVFFIVLLHLLSAASSFSDRLPSNSPRGLLLQDKTRLGSIPPSCHNKCNECHPCMAVQVPPLPSHDRVHPGQTRLRPVDFFVPLPSGASKKYSDYKPLGWKCRCGNHFYNP